MAYNYINKSGLQYIWNKIKAKFVAKDGDKVLSDNNFTDALKTKLDGIATGANKTTVDTALSSTSTNPVQNKVINSALGQKLSTTGTAAAAKKLATARTVQTNLGSATAASFDGTGNITPGITGTLTVAHGGTGATTAASARTNLGITPANIGALPSSGTAASATKLATGRTIRTNLGSTSTATFDGTVNVTPGVTGTLPIANGGTGATTAANARSNLGIGSSATKSISSATNTRDAVAYISTDGVMEIGPYIDLHSNEEGTEDYDVRMGITSSNTTFTKPVNVASGGTGLTASPSMLTNLGSTTAASVLQASPRPGITGTLAVGHGGTGMTSNPSLQVNLASGSAASVFASSPRPGVTGILPVSHGGTGVNTLANLKKQIVTTTSNSEVLNYINGTGSATGTEMITLDNLKTAINNVNEGVLSENTYWYGNIYTEQEYPGHISFEYGSNVTGADIGMDTILIGTTQITVTKSSDIDITPRRASSSTADVIKFIKEGTYKFSFAMNIANVHMSRTPAQQGITDFDLTSLVMEFRYTTQTDYDFDLNTPNLSERILGSVNLVSAWNTTVAPYFEKNKKNSFNNSYEVIIGAFSTTITIPSVDKLWVVPVFKYTGHTVPDPSYSGGRSVSLVAQFTSFSITRIA